MNVSDSGERFRRLGKSKTGNLFEHFGVEVEPTPDADALPEWSAIVDATQCPTCGWYAVVGRACEQCGETVREA